MHDIWKGLAPLPLPIRALFTGSNEIRRYNTKHGAKGNYLWKEVKLELLFFENYSHIMELNFTGEN